jgi:hypothetical protein
MKTIQNLKTLKLSRVDDKEAFRLTESGNYKYIAKSIWKESNPKNIDNTKNRKKK